MNDILNFTYKRDNSVDSDVFIPKEIDGDFVIFENGARCKIETLQNDFIKVDINSLNENIDGNNHDNDSINPDTFFDTPLAIDLDTVEKAVTNPGSIAPSERINDSVSLDNRYEKVNPGGNSNTNNNNGLLGRLDDNSDVQEGPNNTQQNNAIRLPEWDVFDRVKKADEIEILIPFTIKLPRAEKIDALNDMFETSFISYLAKQYIKENVINNSLGIQKTIAEGIENWMETELYGNKNKKQTTRKKTTTSKKTQSTIKEPKIIPVEEVSVPVDNEVSANDLFNTNTPKWDGIIKTLFMINTNEQYNAIKKQIENLKENNPESLDLDRYEDMVSVYEDQIKNITAK
jgi:hypothetical protein